jgi:predicted nucleic acid-binding protein
MTSKLPARLVVDANVILSAVVGGKAADLVWAMPSELVTAAHTLQEVMRYLPTLADKAGIPLEVALGALRLLPITAYRRTFYGAKVAQARDLIGGRDPDDVDLLALALKLISPIWTNDRDFRGLGIEIYTTAQLAAMCDESALPGQG